jgi:hypothetical protein
MGITSLWTALVTIGTLVLVSSCGTQKQKDGFFSCVDKNTKLGTEHNLLYKYDRRDRTIRLVSVDGDTSMAGTIASGVIESDGKILWEDNNPEFGRSLSSIETKSMVWKTEKDGEVKLTWKCSWK